MYKVWCWCINLDTTKSGLISYLPEVLETEINQKQYDDLNNGKEVFLRIVHIKEKYITYIFKSKDDAQLFSEGAIAGLNIEHNPRTYWDSVIDNIINTNTK